MSCFDVRQLTLPHVDTLLYVHVLACRRRRRTVPHARFTQAWCLLQVKLCDPCLSALKWCSSCKALYKCSPLPFFTQATQGLKHSSKLTQTISHDKFQPCHWQLVVYVAFLALYALRCVSKAANQGWLEIYHRYMLLIYVGYISDIFVWKYRFDFLIFNDFLIFLMWHIVTVFWFSVLVFCWLMTCALSIFSVLDNFCQIAPLHSNAVWMTILLYLICKAHTYTTIW